VTALTPDPQPVQLHLPHTDRVKAALEELTDALDAAHADGLVIPPAAATGATTLNVALVVIHGQELARNGVDPMQAVPMPTAADLMAALRG